LSFPIRPARRLRWAGRCDRLGYGDEFKNARGARLVLTNRDIQSRELLDATSKGEGGKPPSRGGNHRQSRATSAIVIAHNRQELIGRNESTPALLNQCEGCFDRSKTMNIFYIIGVVVVIVVVAGFFGLRF
jgi:hypothetical protein